MNDSGASLIITNSQILGLAQNLFDGSRSCIDMDHLDTSLAPDNSGIALSPDSISCILYTSGSTGQPKGVLHTHRNELHSIMHHTNNLRLSADDRFSLLAPYGTGQGIQDIFSALLNGGTLYPWNMKSEGLNGLADWLVHEKITVYHSAATIFRLIDDPEQTRSCAREVAERLFDLRGPGIERYARLYEALLN